MLQEVFSTYSLGNVIVVKPDQKDRKASFKKEKDLPFEVTAAQRCLYAPFTQSA